MAGYEPDILKPVPLYTPATTSQEIRVLVATAIEHLKQINTEIIHAF